MLGVYYLLLVEPKDKRQNSGNKKRKMARKSILFGLVVFGRKLAGGAERLALGLRKR
jgi:hypothetical protein